MTTASSSTRIPGCTGARIAAAGKRWDAVRTGWLSLPHLLPGGTRSTTAAGTAPAVGPGPAVALYAVAPLRGVEHLVLDDLAAYADDRGWIVPAGCAVADSGPLDQSPAVRAGWQRVRAAATGRLVHGVVVPSFAHIAYRAADWERERAWLLEQGLFVVATDPTELQAGLTPEELRA
ncbi:hypothetical protein AMK17_35745 [Streptomyces sp. CB00072]|uniref:hypothetical protein n=1 Tax=Streptomyces sp. CB00072 TaxID=1703928 RepID=UPI00093E775E|nr:hypothetical protein [Streptomyces sp. CB00072]OKI50729.1 hypothetical protein AMK17_35745 [Streptomyces sp. CB00072]